MTSCRTCLCRSSLLASSGFGVAVGAASASVATRGFGGVDSLWWPAPRVRPSKNAAAAAESSAVRRRRTTVCDGSGSGVLRCRERAAVDQLDAVAVGVLDEADAPDLRAAAGVEGRLLGLDSDLGERGQERVEVVDRQGDVVVAVAEVVGLVAADVD